MADTFELEVATPERLYAREQVSEAEVPGKNGYIGILAGHAPLLSALGAGVLSFGTGGKKQIFAVDGGFLEIFENHVRILADRVEPVAEIQSDQVRRDLEEGNKDLRQVHDEAESAKALRKVQSAQAKIDALERSR